MNAEALNPHLKDLPRDVLYHLGLDTDMDLQKMFGDIKYVCMGGSPERARRFACHFSKGFGITFPPEGLQPVGKTDRYTLYKVGPVISVSHGIGMGSLSILLHEITKLLHHAECKDVTYIRIGTSGGIGLDPGTVVVTEQAVNAEMQPFLEQYALGDRQHYPTELDRDLAKEIAGIRGDIQVVLGKTMGTDDFYEGQARFDGALDPPYTKKERQIFWELAQERGVKNIEMEATEFAAFCMRAKIRAAIVNAVIIDRLKGDQVNSTSETLQQYSDNAQQIVLDFIKGTEEKVA